MRRLMIGFALGLVVAAWILRDQRQDQDVELRRRAREIADDATEVARQLNRQ